MIGAGCQCRATAWQPQSELVVQASADNVVVQGNIAPAEDRTGESHDRRGEVAGILELNEEVFGLDRPIAGEGIFAASAGGPTPSVLGFSERGKTRRGHIGFNSGDCKSAGS